MSALDREARPASRTRVVLVRHAAPSHEARHVVYGRLDFELCIEGVAQADSLGEELARTPFTAVYSSPQRRAIATAAPLARLLGLDPVVVDDLREIDFGRIEGADRAEVIRLNPDLMDWTSRPTLVFPGGESVGQVCARASAAAGGIVARHPGEAVAVFSHSIPIRAIVADALRIPDEAIFRLDSAYGGISTIDWFGELPLVRSLNASTVPI